MYPTICRIGPLTVHSYGLMMVVAIVVCAFLLRRDARGTVVPPDAVLDVIFLAMLGGLIGARLFYVVLFWDYFLSQPLEILMIQKGGLAWQGGFIGATAVLIGTILKKKWPIWESLDLFAPYAALGQSIGRVGCFLNGCCHGRHWESGLYFPVHGDVLHPTQLYDAFGLFLIFLVLRRQRKVSLPGVTAMMYVMLATSLRFVVEFFRADHDLLAFGLSIYQFISIGLFSIAGLVLIRLRKRS